MTNGSWNDESVINWLTRCLSSFGDNWLTMNNFISDGENGVCVVGIPGKIAVPEP